MATLLNSLVQYIWIVDFTVFCLLGFLALKQYKFSSSVMTQSIIIIISGTIIQYENMALSIMSPSTSLEVLNYWLFGFTLFDIASIYVFFQLFNYFKAKHSSHWLRIGFSSVYIGFMAVLIWGQYLTLYSDDAGMSYKVWKLLAFHLGLSALYGLAIFVISKCHELANLRHKLIARTYILAFSVSILIQIFRLYEKYFFETNYLAGLYKWGNVGINTGTSAVAVFIAAIGLWQYLTKREKRGILWTL